MIGEDQVAFLLEWLESTGARKTSEEMRVALFIRFNLEVSVSAVRKR